MSVADAVAAVFDAYQPLMRQRLMELRQLIFDTAAATKGVGRIEETLKWGQISYLTPETKSGTTIRIDARGSGVAMFVSCKTDLVARYRETYPQSFAYEGDRALLIEDGAPLDKAALGHCIAMALTYHQRRGK